MDILDREKGAAEGPEQIIWELMITEDIETVVDSLKVGSEDTVEIMEKRFGHTMRDTGSRTVTKLHLKTQFLYLIISTNLRF